MSRDKQHPFLGASARFRLTGSDSLKPLALLLSSSVHIWKACTGDSIETPSIAYDVRDTGQLHLAILSRHFPRSSQLCALIAEQQVGSFRLGRPLRQKNPCLQKDRLPAAAETDPRQIWRAG